MFNCSILKSDVYILHVHVKWNISDEKISFILSLLDQWLKQK